MEALPSALIVDDDTEASERLSGLLQAAGVSSARVTSGARALRVLEERRFTFVVTDLELAIENQASWLSKVTGDWPGVPVVVSARTPDAPEAEVALREGALDVLAKPFEPEEVAHVAEKAIEVAARGDEPPLGPRAPPLLVGQSRAMRDVSALIELAAQGRATVLVRGETGTGKDLAARALHDLGPRRSRPFVKIDCTALPEALLESELFGHEKGAFTGATRSKPGRAELADGGTLFLDEIGELALPLQAKLLRLVQEQEFERLGGTATLRVDVRVIAATHRDLEQMIEARTFREDLFYRLNVVPLWMPPLRARRDDIEPLVVHFAEVFAESNGKPRPLLEPGALRLLRRERWPGNVRQLQNLVERLVVLGENAVLGDDAVRAELTRRQGGFATEPLSETVPPPLPSAATRVDESSLDADVRLAEKRSIERALAQAGGNRSLAARLLRVSRSRLYAKLEEHGLL